MRTEYESFLFLFVYSFYTGAIISRRSLRMEKIYADEFTFTFFVFYCNTAVLAAVAGKLRLSMPYIGVLDLVSLFL